MSKDKALRLALEALEYPGPSWIEARQPAITAIKQALAQPEPEPVALLRSLGPKPWETSESAHAQMKLILDFEKAYTSPPVATNDTSNNRVDETAKHRHEPVAIIASLMPAERHALLDEVYSIHDALYIYPPKREWQGLTNDEIDQGLLRSNYAFKTAEAWRAGVVFAMTKLKEKNT